MRRARHLALLAGLLAGFATPALADPDNFLIVIADDVGVDKIGAYEAGECVMGECPDPPATPTIDGLAAEGVLFRNAWATPVCSSSRAAALTGRLGHRTGVGSHIVGKPYVFGVDPDAPNIANTLKAAGYDTAAFGKWHMAGCIEVDGVCSGVAHPPNGHPILSGFDYWAGSNHNLVGNYCSWEKAIAERTGPGVDDWDVEALISTTYATTDTTDEAVARIPTMTEPWLAWVAYNASHAPVHEPPANPYGCTQTKSNDDVAMFDDMTAYMDSEIGRLLAAIDPAVLARTTILFWGDNGTIWPAIVPPSPANHGKSTPYEGGVGVPLIVSGPHVPPASEGGESDGLVHVADLFATTMAIAGLNPCPMGSGCGEDGISLLPYLADTSQASLRSLIYSEYFHPNTFDHPPEESEHAARDDRYKLIHFFDGQTARLEFYDLDTDPFEQADLLTGTLTPQEESTLATLAAEMATRSGLCPALDDQDADCVVDTVDNCLGVPNGPLEKGKTCGGDQIDSDADGAGDACMAAQADATFAIPMAYECQLPFFLALLDLETLTGGAVVSGATLVEPQTLQETELPAAVPDVLNPGSDLDLVAIADAGLHPTTSGVLSIGVDDPGDAGRIAAGTELTFAFDPPLVSFGLDVVIPGDPGVAVGDGDLELVAEGGLTATLSTSDSWHVGTVASVEHHAYFLAVWSDTPFASATLRAGPITLDGAFHFTIDDLRPVPEPGRWLLLAAGAGALAIARRRG